MRIVLDKTVAPAARGISRGLLAAAAWWRQLCLLALLALATACNSNDPFRNYAGAVGPDLYTRQTAQNTSLLNAYTSSICAQAGLYTSASGGCTLSTPADWKTFVDMGLYDIDQRCDTFLDGLYYKVKSTGPILAQISNTRSFTRAVLEATKTSNAAIWIVAAAFDLTEATFRNSRTSLLEALDPTTVKSIVFKRQQEVKKEIYRSTISSKPQALHALRTYLRVCMPFTIEMEANAILTSVQRTGEVGDSPIMFENSMAVGSGDFARKQGGSGPGGTRIPPSPTDKTVEAMYGPNSNRQLADVHADQKRLCIATPGTYGDKTWTAVAIYRRAIPLGGNPTLTGDGPFFNLSDPAQQAEHNRFVANDITGGTVSNGVTTYCDTGKYINYFEADFLGSPATAADFAKRVNALNLPGVSLESSSDAAALSSISSSPASAFRQNIAKLRANLGACGLTEVLKDGQAHVTKNLDRAIDAKTSGQC